MFRSGFDIAFRILNRAKAAILSLKAHERAINILAIGHCLCEAEQTVKAVRCRQYLYVVRLCGFEYHAPVIALYGMVNAIFRFIDEQETVAAIGQCQSDAREVQCPVAKTLQRDWTGLTAELYYHPLDMFCIRYFIAAHRNALQVVAKNQSQGLHRSVFIFC